jgi:hypothetical protein
MEFVCNGYVLFKEVVFKCRGSIGGMIRELERIWKELDVV